MKALPVFIMVERSNRSSSDLNPMHIVNFQKDSKEKIDDSSVVIYIVTLRSEWGFTLGLMAYFLNNEVLITSSRMFLQSTSSHN